MNVSSHLKLPEVAMRLGVSEKTARRYIKSGTLPSIFVGNAYRVHPDDLATFVEGASVGHGVTAKLRSPKAQAAPSSEEGAARYVVPAGDLARMFRNLARRGQRIVERSVGEGASEELSRETSDYHEEAATLLRVKGGRDIRGQDPEELAEAVEDYEEVEARIQRLLAQDIYADKAERAESLRFKKDNGGGYAEERGADAS